MKQKDALLLAKKYKATLKNAGIPFTNVIIFGSVARNKAHENSDIDIAVVGTSFGKDRFEEMQRIRELRWPVSYKIQPIWFYPEHLENRYSTLAKEIRNEGISVE